MMAALKRKKQWLIKIFGIFERWLAQKPTNWFFQPIWKTLIKSKNMGSQGIISIRKLFQNLLHSKFQEIVDKRNIMVFWNFSWSVIRRKKT